MQTQKATRNHRKINSTCVFSITANKIKENRNSVNPSTNPASIVGQSSLLANAVAVVASICVIAIGC